MRIVFFDDMINFLRGRGHPALTRRAWLERHNQLETIVVLGDSHTFFFAGNDHLKTKRLGFCGGVINTAHEKLAQYSVIHLGPSLAYNTNKYGTTIRTLEKVDYLLKTGLLRPRDRVLCCFGEIDIRVHVMKHAEQRGGDYQMVIDQVLSNYLEFLLYLRAKGLQLCCWGPVPQCRVNEQHFCRGSQVDRNKATRYFIEQLSILGEKNHFGVVSLFEEMVDENLVTNEAYLLDGFHLNQKAMVLLEGKNLIFG